LFSLSSILLAIGHAKLVLVLVLVPVLVPVPVPVALKSIILCSDCKLCTLFVCAQAFECPKDRTCEQHEHVCGRRGTRAVSGAAFFAGGVFPAEIESEDDASGWRVSGVVAANLAGSGRHQAAAFPILAAGG